MIVKSLGEELHHIAAASVRMLDRLVIAAGNRHVSAQKRHAITLAASPIRRQADDQGNERRANKKDQP